MNDELVNTRLYNPHDHDFVYRRSDGSFYAIEIRKGKDDNTKELPGYEPWVAPSRPLQLSLFQNLNKYGQARGQRDWAGNLINEAADMDYNNEIGLEPDPNYKKHNK